MVILILTLVLIFLLTWVLVSPLLLQIDTRQNQYVLRWLGFVQAALVPMQDDLLLRIWLFFWHRDFSLIKILAKPKTPKPTRTRNPAFPKKNKTKWHFTLNRFLKLLKTFRVRYFYWHLDTDDFVTNAYLYPLCRAVRSPTRWVAINFEGHNECNFQIENRLGKVLIALFF